MWLLLADELSKLLYLSWHFENVVLPNFEVQVNLNHRPYFVHKFRAATQLLEKLIWKRSQKAEMHRPVMVIRVLILLWEVCQDQINRLLSWGYHVDHIWHGIPLSMQFKLLSVVNVSRFHQVKHWAEVWNHLHCRIVQDHNDIARRVSTIRLHFVLKHVSKYASFRVVIQVEESWLRL